jgi:hypothetical protein
MRMNRGNKNMITNNCITQNIRIRKSEQKQAKMKRVNKNMITKNYITQNIRIMNKF